jgi:hypothetical protein
MKRLLYILLALPLTLAAQTTATPTFSSVAGICGQRVTISDATGGATIHYTVDGSTPTTSSPVFNWPIPVCSSQTLKAMATASGHANSAVASSSYSIAPINTQFYISGNSHTDVPSPFPHVNRSIVTGWKYLLLHPDTDCGTYDWSNLDDWLSETDAHPGSVNLYTIWKFPKCANGTTNDANPPTDIASGNTLFHDFMVALFNHLGGLSGPPGSPTSYTTYRKMLYLEGINEFNTNGYWNSTDANAKTMLVTEMTVTRQYCSDCQVLFGSTSAGGKGREYYDTALLAALSALSSGDPKPDGISFHNYPSHDNIRNAPPPESFVSNNDAACTPLNAPNNACNTPIISQVAHVQGTAVLGNSAIKSWAAGLPVFNTEGGYNINPEACDTDTADCDENPEGTSFVSKYRAAWDARWMMVTWSQKPVWTMLYANREQCWNTMWGTGSSPAPSGLCPSTPVIPSGATYKLTVFNKVVSWLAPATLTSPVSCSSLTGGLLCTMSVTVSGSPAQFAWWTGWKTTHNMSTTFTSSEDVNGSTASLSGSVTLDMLPKRLYGAAPPPPTAPQIVGGSTSAGGMGSDH